VILAAATAAPRRGSGRVAALEVIG
jgi:hypothetical protein